MQLRRNARKNSVPPQPGWCRGNGVHSVTAHKIPNNGFNMYSQLMWPITQLWSGFLKVSMTPLLWSTCLFYFHYSVVWPGCAFCVHLLYQWTILLFGNKFRRKTHTMEVFSKSTPIIFWSIDLKINATKSAYLCWLYKHVTTVHTHWRKSNCHPNFYLQGKKMMKHVAFETLQYINIDCIWELDLVTILDLPTISFKHILANANFLHYIFFL